MTSKLDPKAITDSDRYLRFVFVDKTTLQIDDCEFYFTLNDNTIQFRSSRRGKGVSDFGANRRRIEDVRQRLHFENVEVLRNRIRVLKFMESPFDSFGPPTSVFDRFSDDEVIKPSTSRPISSTSITGIFEQMYNGVHTETRGGDPIWEVKRSSFNRGRLA